MVVANLNVERESNKSPVPMGYLRASFKFITMIHSSFKLVKKINHVENHIDSSSARSKTMTCHTWLKLIIPQYKSFEITYCWYSVTINFNKIMSLMNWKKCVTREIKIGSQIHGETQFQGKITHVFSGEVTYFFPKFNEFVLIMGVIFCQIKCSTSFL